MKTLSSSPVARPARTLPGRRLSLLHLLLVVPVGFTAGLQAQLSLDEVAVVNQRGYASDVPQNSWQYNLSVVGNGITSVTVSGPLSTSFILDSYDGGHSWGTGADFASPGGLRDAFPVGTYTFHFNGGPTSLAVNFTGAEPQQIPTGIWPPNGATGVPLQPTFTWNSVNPSAGAAIATDLFRMGPPYDYEVDQAHPLAMTATSWEPSVALEANAQHQLAVGIYEGSLATSAIEGHSFPVYSVYGYVNSVNFTTVPEPAAWGLVPALFIPAVRYLRRRKASSMPRQ